MKAVLILSLALVLLASGTFSEPSRVKLPSDRLQDLKTKGKELYQSYLSWRAGLPKDGDKTLLAYVNWLKAQKQERELTSEPEVEAEIPLAEVEQPVDSKPLSEGEVQIDSGGPQPPKLIPLVSALGFNKAELEALYQKWLPKIPVGEDSSFQAFLDWMKEQEEPKNDGGLGPENYRWGRFIRWTKKIVNWVKKITRKEYIEDGQNLAEVQRSVGDDEQHINEQEVLTDGENLAEVQRSVEDDGPQINQQEELRAFGRGEDEEQQAAVYGERSVVNEKTARDQDDWNDYWEDYYGYEDKRDLAKWFKQMGKYFRPKPRPRELEEEQEQAIVNDQRSLAGEEDRALDLELASDLQPSNKPGPRSYVYYGKDLFDLYRTWLKNIAEEKDKTFQKFVEWFKQKKTRSLSDQSQLTENERREDDKQDLEPVVLEEVKTEDTSGPYSCESNSPCTAQNIVNEQFYFATASVEKFIQCSAWGNCATLTCGDGLIWDDKIKTCSIRT